MYLKGSKWSMQKRRRRSNPLRVLILLVLLAGALYVNQVVVPATPPLFIPTPTATRSPESFVTDAETLVSQGKLLQAVEQYKTAIQVDPKNPANYIAIARLQIYTNFFEEAVENAENALLINPNNATAHAIRGWALFFLGDYLVAEAAIRQAIELEPNNSQAYAYLAEVLATQSQLGIGTIGTLDKAVEASRAAMALSPDSLETHRSRGIVLEITGNYTEAANEFEAAIAINPNIADLHLALGRSYRFLEQYDKAIEEFNRANALNPADPDPDTFISRTYSTVGEYAKAIQFAQQAIKDDPLDPYLYGNLGSMYSRNAQYLEAIEPLRIAVRGGNTAEGSEVTGLSLDYGRIAEYYSSYGLSLARVGECGEALQISQLLLEGVPTDEIAIFNAETIVQICVETAESGPQIVPSDTPEGEVTQ